MSVKICVPVSDEFISDILITAFDAKCGGCRYWATVVKVFAEENDDETVGNWHSVGVTTPEENRAIWRVDRKVIENGIQMFVNSVYEIREAVLSQDAGEIGSAFSDRIVQVGLFGKMIYG